MNFKKDIQIIMPSYNKANFIEEAINSVLMQRPHIIMSLLLVMIILLITHLRFQNHILKNILIRLRLLKMMRTLGCLQTC